MARYTQPHTQKAIDGYGHDKIQCSLAYHLLLVYANAGGNGGGGNFSTIDIHITFVSAFKLLEHTMWEK